MQRIDTLEPVPKYYETNAITQEMVTNGQTELALLTNLRNEVLYSRGEGVSSSTYSVARSLGDLELYREGDGRISSLLDSSRFTSRPNTFLTTTADSGLEMPSSGYHTASGHFALELDYVNGRALDATLQGFRELGITERTLGDAHLVTVLAVGAHEAGHALLAGVGHLARAVEHDDRGNILESVSLPATRLYLGSHPEDAFSGNWNTDVRIHEERFAEGYAHIVIRKSLEVLGYDADESERILELVSADLRSMGTEEGRHQIDHIDEVGPTMSIVDVMKKIKSDGADILPSQENPGELGYGTALTKDEIAEQLSKISLLILNRKEHGFKGVKPDPEEWYRLVKQSQSEQTRGLVEALKTKRMEALASHLGKNAISMILDKVPKAERTQTRVIKRELVKRHPDRYRRATYKRAQQERKNWYNPIIRR